MNQSSLELIEREVTNEFAKNHSLWDVEFERDVTGVLYSDWSSMRELEKEILNEIKYSHLSEKEAEEYAKDEINGYCKRTMESMLYDGYWVEK